MSASLLLALAWLVVAALASIGTRSLRRFSRSKLEELLHQEPTRPLHRQIVQRRDRAALAAESLQTLAAMLAIISATVWQVNTFDRVNPLGWLVPAISVLVGLLLYWCALVWIPTAIARLWGDALVLRTWSFWQTLSRVLAPSVWGAEFLTALIRRLARRPPPGPTEEAFEEEILTMVKAGEQEGLLEEEAREMIEGVIELGDVTVAKIMTPRTDMVTLHVDEPWDEAISLVSQSGHTRIPVHSRSPDDVVGILHTKDLLVELAKPSSQPRRQWTEILRKPYFVPETKPVDDLLQEFQRSHNQIAVVINEFGGVSGLVTIEDVLEEIVGEIVDEHDKHRADGIKPLGDHAAEALANVRIHDVNERLGLTLPEDGDFDTIGGFVFHELGRIPNVGEELVWHDVRIKVLDATRRRINRVAIQVLSRAE